MSFLILPLVRGLEARRRSSETETQTSAKDWKNPHHEL